MDINLALMTGIDFPILENKLIIHQPKLKEIALIGENTYFYGISILCIEKKDCLTSEELIAYPNITNFSLFTQLITTESGMVSSNKDIVLNVLKLLFPNYVIMITPNSLLFTKQEEVILVDENNFELWQSIIAEVACVKKNEEQDYNPGTKKAKEIADKLKKARAKVAKMKSKENQKNSMIGQNISILVIGLHMDIESASSLTFYQIQDIIARYSLYINWDLGIRTRLAGGTPDSELVNWMKPIH